MTQPIKWFEPHFWGKEKDYVLDALDSTWISGGKYVDDFEQRFAEIVSSPHAISVSNGTTALELALLTLGIGNGDEVIVPGFTFSAPANMALAVGATPVYADVDADTWCLSPAAVEKAITPKTKAVIPVHIYGNLCNMPAIMEIAANHNLHVIEDVAEAAFTTLNGQHAGTFGTIGCFSFQATKTITTGEGGMVILADDQLADQARLIRNHGMRPNKRYWHEVVGHNFRLTNFQAAMGLAQLEAVDNISTQKKRVFESYKQRLYGQDGIILQTIQPETDPVMWAVAIMVDEKVFGLSRDEICQHLEAKGIETRPGFYAFSEMPIYNAPALPNSLRASQTIISLPSYAMLTDDQIDYICQTLLNLRP